MDVSEKKEIAVISVVFFAFSLFFLAMSIINGNYEYAYYNSALLLGFVVLFAFYNQIHLKIPLLAGLTILALLHLAGGNVSDNGIRLYQTSLYSIPYDKIVHVFGSFVVTLIAYNFIEKTLGREDRKKTLLVGFIILMIGVGAGAIVEIMEFLATLMFRNTIVGDYTNNAGDLVANLVGSLAALVFSLHHFTKKKKA